MIDSVGTRELLLQMKKKSGYEHYPDDLFELKMLPSAGNELKVQLIIKEDVLNKRIGDMEDTLIEYNKLRKVAKEQK